MINNYGMFNLHETNNELLLLFSDLSVTNKVKHKEVICLFHNETLVGYSIPNFIRYAKIKYSGIIFLPNKILIDVINSLLINEGLEPLGYKSSSGYLIEERDNHKVVVAQIGVFLRDQTISKGHICTYHDLYIDSENPNDILYLDDEKYFGNDFFKTEAK